MLLLAASLTPACIIPVGPEWQDPPGKANSAPYVFDEFPAEGSKVVSTTDAFIFSVTPTDDDVGDDLFVKWILEYPPFSNNTKPQMQQRIRHSDDGKRLQQENTFPVSCQFLSSVLTTHQIYVAIADQPFIESGNSNDLITPTNNGKRAVVTWTLEKSCLSSP